MKMEDNQQQEVEKLAERHKVSPEFVKAVFSVKRAGTMHDKLEAFNKERALIEQGNPEAISKQHEEGKLTARERVNKLADPAGFEELDLWHRPLETGFDIGEEIGRGDGVVIGYGKANEVPVAVEKGISDATKNMVPISLKGTTIPHAVKGRCGASKLILLPAWRPAWGCSTIPCCRRLTF